MGEIHRFETKYTNNQRRFETNIIIIDILSLYFTHAVNIYKDQIPRIFQLQDERLSSLRTTRLISVISTRTIIYGVLMRKFHQLFWFVDNDNELIQLTVTIIES